MPEMLVCAKKIAERSGSTLSKDHTKQQRVTDL